MLTDTITRVEAEATALQRVLEPIAPTPVLGLDELELEDVLVAIGDLEDRTGPDQRARLRRARHALERELSRVLAHDR